MNINHGFPIEVGNDNVSGFRVKPGMTASSFVFRGKSYYEEHLYNSNRKILTDRGTVLYNDCTRSAGGVTLAVTNP